MTTTCERLEISFNRKTFEKRDFENPQSSSGYASAASAANLFQKFSKEKNRVSRRRRRRFKFKLFKGTEIRLIHLKSEFKPLKSIAPLQDGIATDDRHASRRYKILSCAVQS